MSMNLSAYGLGVLIGLLALLAHAYVLTRLGLSPALVYTLVMFLGFGTYQHVEQAGAAPAPPAPAVARAAAPEEPAPALPHAHAAPPRQP